MTRYPTVHLASGRTPVAGRAGRMAAGLFLSLLAGALADDPPAATPTAAPGENSAPSTATAIHPGTSRPPRAIHTVAPVHPPELHKKLIGGACEIECLVSDQGHVVYTKVLNASLPEFGAAAEAAVRQWEFQPGERDGKPIAMAVRIPFSFTFTPEEVLNVVAGRKVFQEVKDTVIPAEQLPAWPQPTHIYLPKYPPELKGTGKYGKAVVSFIVDKDGNVINPKIVKTTYPEFAMPALATAVRLVYPPQVVGNKHQERICVSQEIEFEFNDPDRLKKPDQPAKPAAAPAKAKAN